MRKKIILSAIFLSVFILIDYCCAQNPSQDLNQDGKRDFAIDFQSGNPFSIQRGENFKHAEFDTNFDGKMDIIIDFGFSFGSLKRDSEFDGNFDIKCAMFHIRPMSMASTSRLGRLDTWHVIGLSTGVKNLLDYLIDSYASAETNYISIINESLKNGMDIDTKDENGDTLLMRIVRSGYLDITKLLITKGANVNVKNNDGITLLMQAIQGGSPGLVKSTILMTEDTGQIEHFEIMKLLIEKGADINARSKDASTVLMQAVQSGYLATAKLLVKYGADVNAKNNEGLTPLMAAVKRDYNDAGYSDMVKLLIENKVDMNAQDNNGLTVLMFAMQKDYHSDYLDMARFLIEQGADVNIKADDGSTVLLQVVKKAKFGYTGVIEMLIEKGADIGVKDNNGFTTFMMAVQSGASEIPVSLIKKGIDINEKDNEGLTALIQRGKELDFQMVWLLIQLGANVDSRDKTGDTVLMQFIAGGCPDQAESLLSEGLDINAKNNSGRTALMCAVEKGYLKLASAMLAKGADVNAKDNAGRSIFDIAQSTGNNEMISLIEDYGVRRLQLYKNEEQGFEIKIFTDRAPVIHNWEEGRHHDMPTRLWDAEFFDRDFGVLRRAKQTVEIPAVSITVNVCFFQNLDLCLQNAASDCGRIPYGNLITTYGSNSLVIIPDIFLGCQIKRLKVSCGKDMVYEGIAVLRGNRLYTIMFLTAFEGGKAFSGDIVDSMLSTFRFAGENIAAKD